MKWCRLSCSPAVCVQGRENEECVLWLLVLDWEVCGDVRKMKDCYRKREISYIFCSIYRLFWPNSLSCVLITFHFLYVQYQLTIELFENTFFYLCFLFKFISCNFDINLLSRLLNFSLYFINPINQIQSILPRVQSDPYHLYKHL